MCGIAGFVRLGTEGPSREDLVALWTAQEFRGRDAAGLAYLDKDRTTRYLKMPTSVTKMIPQMAEEVWAGLLSSRVGAFHARHRTQGHESNPVNNHPIITHDWMVTHNGIISNDKALWEKLDATKRPGEVDSSAINLVLAQAAHDDEAGFSGALGTLAGSMAMAGWCTKYPDVLVLARTNGSDLYLAKDTRRNILYWSSIERAVQTAADNGEDATFAGLPLWGVPTALIPDNTALCIRVSPGEAGYVRRYAIPTIPFFSLRPSYTQPTTVYPPNTPSAGAFTVNNWGGTGQTQTPSSQLSWPIVRPPSDAGNSTLPTTPPGIKPRYTPKQTRPGYVPLEDYDKLGKPLPLVAGLPPRCYGSSIPAVETATVVETPYGRWMLSPQGPAFRVFRPHRRIQVFWDSLVGGARHLPAVTASLWDKAAAVEVVRLVGDDGVVSIAYMCPWCGVVETLHTWRSVWSHNCGWCLVDAREPGV
jgi:hypothetical protein